MISLSYRTHLATKVKGEISMSGKPRYRETIKRYAWRDLDDMVKARLLEPKYPRCKPPTLDTMVNIQCFLNIEDAQPSMDTLQGSRATISSHKGTKWAPKPS